VTYLSTSHPKVVVFASHNISSFHTRDIASLSGANTWINRPFNSNLGDPATIISDKTQSTKYPVPKHPNTKPARKHSEPASRLSSRCVDRIRCGYQAMKQAIERSFMSMKNNLDLSGTGECGRALVATTQCTRSGYLDLIGWEIILRVLIIGRSSLIRRFDFCCPRRVGYFLRKAFMLYSAT